MTIRKDGAATCDGGCGAVVSPTLPSFEHWERTPWQDGPESHLCPRCMARRDRGWLAEDHVLECSRCHRNTIDNPEVTQWRVIPSMTDQPSTMVCLDCFDPASDRRFL
jgi:hypothetical protein